MTKKILAAMVLAFALVLAGGQTPKAEAYEVYVGTYRDDGTRAYLLTETLAGGRGNFSCTVRAGRNYIRYSFWYAGGGPYYRNSWPAEGYVYGSGSPVAIGIWEWVNNR